MNLYEIQKEAQQARYSEFLRNYAFFAFNEEQLKAGLRKFNIQPGQKGVLTVLPGGGYVLSEHFEEFMDMIHTAQAERDAALADPENGTKFALDMFVYELSAHEFTYTGDESEALEALNITPEDLSKNEMLRAALEAAKFLLLRESKDLDLLDRLRNIEDEIYFQYGVNSNPGGDPEREMIKAIADKIKAEGLADKITAEILEQLSAHNYHLVRRAAEIATGR